MPKLFALALTIFVLALIDTWLFGLGALKSLNLQVWMSFIAWGVHFMAGGKVQGVKASAICMCFGALVGMCAAIVAGGVLSGIGALAAPVAVGIGAAVIVLASKVPLLETIPAGFYGFAAIFALIGLGSVAPTAAIVPTILSVVIGSAFGYVSEIVTDILTKKDIALEPGVGKPA
jgi:hypothetical protein